MINFIIFGVLLIFFIYDWVTRTDRLIAFALKIYFGYRRKGFSVIDAQEEVVKALALPQKREDIFKEKELLPEKGDPFLHLLNSNLETDKNSSNIKLDVKLLILALCIQKTFTRIGAKKFLSYQKKINKIYKRISKKYPEIEESESDKKKEFTEDSKELT